ncbi:response regulator transcription factor [Allosphingosinicella deserti]|uniref:DNA-binding response regulator n=1 Tax=Allosphingosinicella deserti TaxID=2116704 RepID=A0A2P7QRU8_9SPHN|nr:response regulator [Sphingomonas deserti]PSJ40703.1 DNA-binding response regulator [Sphingomonas deserti]
MIEARAASPFPRPLVQIVDDDPGMRAALEDLLQSVGYDVASYGSAADLLLGEQVEGPSCLVLDVRLPGVNGLDLQEQLAREGRNLPVVLVTGHGDVPMSVRGMKAGAVDFIEKPFRDQDLLDAVALAIEEGRRRAPAIQRRIDAQRRFATLSPRERQVIDLVIQEKLNKQIAHDLAISEVTVKIHRAAAMRKLGARSIVELTRLGEALGT